MRKYRLELDEEQLSVMNEALEEYFRIRMGQWWTLADELSMQNIDLSPEYPAHGKIFDAFITTRDCIREIFETVNRILDEQLRKKTTRMQIAEDIWQVVRHQMWIDNGRTSEWSVAGSEPMQSGGKPLPQIEEI